MEIEKEKLKTDILESKVKIIAVVMAGLWALFTFNALRTVYKSDAKIAAQEASHVSLEFDLATETIRSDKPGKIGLEVTVTVKNVGIFAVDLDLSSSEVMTVSKLDGCINPNFVGVTHSYPAKAHSYITAQYLRTMSSALVTPGVELKIPFYVEVDGPGLYYASFISYIPKSVLDRINLQELGDLEEESDLPPVWGAQKYFRIEEPT